MTLSIKYSQGHRNSRANFAYEISTHGAQKVPLGDGNMVQQLRALATLPEDPEVHQYPHGDSLQGIWYPLLASWALGTHAV